MREKFPGSDSQAKKESLAAILQKGREVIRSIAIKEEAESEEPVLYAMSQEEVTRREALRRIKIGAGGMAVVGALGGGIKMYKDAVEENEIIRERSDEFFKETAGYRAQLQLRYDQVVFVDQDGSPIETVDISDKLVQRVSETGELEEYELSAGIRNEDGVIDGGLAGEWLEFQRQELAKKYPDMLIDDEEGVPRVLTVYQDFIEVLNNPDEVELSELIRSGEVSTKIDLIRYFADKPVVGQGDVSRKEFVVENIKFSRWNELGDREGQRMPQSLAEELSLAMPGIAAVQSGFNNSTPGEGAGVFKLSEQVWAGDYGVTTEEIESLEKQIEVMGQYMNRLYTDTLKAVNPLVLRQLEVLHPEEEVLQVEVLAPLILNAFKATPTRTAEAVNRYFAVAENRAHQLQGRDLFRHISEFGFLSEEGSLAEYKNNSREFVPRVYAAARELQDDSWFQ